MKVAPGYTACCNASPVWRGISDAKLLWSRKAGTDHVTVGVSFKRCHGGAWYTHLVPHTKFQMNP